MAAPYRSAQKLHRDRCLSEITSNATLKATALANLGISTSGTNPDNTFAVVDDSDATKKINFSAGGATTGKTATIAAVNALDATYTLPAATDTLTGRASTDTLTNKTLTSPVINTPTIKQLTEVVTATNVITAAETGSVFFLNSATEFVSTLPAPAAGLAFTFIVTAAPSGASYTVTTNAAATIIKGRVLTNDVNSATDADFGTAGEATVTFVDGKSVAGDTAQFWCDGTNWFVVATASVFDAITIS